METVTEIRNQLSQAGIKATHPRIVIFQELLQSKEHPSAELVHERIREANPSISMGSVYRVLDTLVEAGLIKRVSVKSGSMRYDANLEPHNHIYCYKTDQIHDFFDEELNDLINDFFQRKQIMNFKIKDVKLQIHGECTDPDHEVKIFNT